MSLKLIYHFQTSQNQDQEFRPASYAVIYFFSDDGFLDERQLRELAKAIPNADHEGLTFLNLDDLKSFAARVGEELAVREVRLISVQDYNIGIDGAKDLATFTGVFEKYGEIVVNETVKKKGLFGKFFT